MDQPLLSLLESWRTLNSDAAANTTDSDYANDCQVRADLLDVIIKIINEGKR